MTSGNPCILSKCSNMLFLDAFLQGGAGNFQEVLKKCPGISIHKVKTRWFK